MLICQMNPNQEDVSEWQLEDHEHNHLQKDENHLDKKRNDIIHS